MENKFNYTKFVNDITQKAEKLLTDNVQDKEYIISSVHNYTFTAAEALTNDTKLNLENEQIIFISQNIAKHIFEKAKDLVQFYDFDKTTRDNILQNIAFIIYEITYQAAKKEQLQFLDLNELEQQISESYQNSINESLNPQNKSLLDDFTIDIDEYNKKLEKINKLIEQNPNYTKYYEDRADLCETICMFIETDETPYRKLLVKDYKKLIELKPEKSNNWYYFLYKSYYHIKEYKKALNALSKSIESTNDPDERLALIEEQKIIMANVNHC